MSADRGWRVEPAFVLVHSLLLDPLTWAPVAARLTASGAVTVVPSPERLTYLRTMATEGRLPQWTTWWDEDDVAPLFPDPRTRSTVSAEQPRLPLSRGQGRR